MNKYILLFLLVYVFLFPCLSAEEKIILASEKLYSINRNRGFEVSEKENFAFREKNSFLPVKVVYPFSGNEIRTFSSVNFNPGNTGSVSVTTPSQLFTTDNCGENWKEIILSYPYKKSYYITSSAVKGEESQSIIIGTSFSGLFETSDGGRSWKSYKDSLMWMEKGAGFFDDISAVAYGSNRYRLFIASGFERKIYALDINNSWSEIPVPEPVKKNGIKSMTSDFSSSTLSVYSGRYCFRYNYGNSEWEKDVIFLPGQLEKSDRDKLIRLEKASEKKGIYLSAYKAGESADEVFSFLRKNRMNSVVVDFKDDFGNLTYNSGISTAAEIGNIKNYIDIDDFVEKADRNNIYVIARIVVFKDRQFYSYKDNSYAVWDRESDSPWGNLIKDGDNPPEQKEFWVDPFSEDVWDYNIEIARELEKKGVDEIQFDYIRFPTDGDLGRAFYRYCKEGMLHNEALESFLRKAREVLSIPVSTDLYGFNGWYRMGNWNGQQIDMVCNYVDVISPMFYPSHFPRKFLEKIPYLERAEYIYREGSSRAVDIVKGRSLIRPFVQAFLIGGERKFERPVYTDYLLKQLKGLSVTDASGFTLWNASGSYYMISEKSTDLIDDVN